MKPKKSRFLWRVWATVLFLCLAVGVILPAGADSAIYSQVVRLHVLANDDSPQAQQVKLRLRDELLAYCQATYADCTTTDQMLSRLQQDRAQWERLANRTLGEWGLPYGARVTVSREHYPTRTYGDLHLPAGEYASLRVILGRGEGKNWWCVLFPPLCLQTSRSQEDLLAQQVGPDTAKVFTVDAGPYRLRFRLLELIASLFGG